MLDEARHFRGKAFVKKFIDWMTLHKFNVFHWHLTDDQGWRIEIKKYPKLTDVAAWRLPAGDGAKLDIDPKSGKPRLIGGYYTQEQIRNIVKYAAERHITIVPEIDIPGHAQAPLMAYPQFGTSDIKAGPVSADWGIFNYNYNLEEKTFTFFEDVLTEVMDLFPGEYIHIGGDEVQKVRWEMDPRIAERMKELGIKSVDEIQSYFTARIDSFLNAHGRKLIGWDEILENGDLAKTATVMSWRGEKGGIEAAHKGYNVVMSPRPILYLDMLQSDSKREVTGRPNYQTLETIYNYNPVPQVLVGHGEEFVLGGQANIWTEHMRRALNVEHMVFPRAAAYS